ncbi:MAG: hypothetical protein H7288_12245 [Kineosporiaceae bacterium]|nr:hypothetical protein [Aeromicrobium sp.]
MSVDVRGPTTVLLPGAASRLKRRRREVERIGAVIGVLAVFLQFPLPIAHLNLSIVVAALLAPVWVGSIPRFRGAQPLMILCVCAVASGLILSAGSAQVRTINVAAGLDGFVELASFAGTLGIVLWARTVLRDSHIVILVGVALLLTVSRAGLFETNPWRFGYSIPVTVIVLGVAWWIGSRRVEIVALLVLAGVSALNDARSNFGMLVLAAILVQWSMRSPRQDRGRSWLPTTLLIAAATWSVFQIAQTLILDGYLGQATQARSVAQLETSGSLILGGRPELTATAALMRHEPLGFGLGAMPRPEEVFAAKTGMASVNYDPNNGYVERYMFGTHFELHSVFGDLWANYGLLGLALTGTIGFVCVRGAALGLRGRNASAAIIYLAIRTMWGLAFSPFSSAAPLIVLLLGLVMTDRALSSRRPPHSDNALPAHSGLPA